MGEILTFFSNICKTEGFKLIEIDLPSSLTLSVVPSSSSYFSDIDYEIFIYLAVFNTYKWSIYY